MALRFAGIAGSERSAEGLGSSRRLAYAPSAAMVVVEDTEFFDVVAAHDIDEPGLFYVRAGFISATKPWLSW